MLKRRKAIFNDGHLGVKRTGGTTPKSANDLRNYLCESFRTGILGVTDCDLIFNGDMFDTFTVDDNLKGFVISCLHEWMQKSEEGVVYWLRGNHDFSAKGDALSSSTLLGNVMMTFYPDRFFMPEPELTELEDKLWAIPHCLNSDLFDHEITKARDTLSEGDTLFLHCNYASPYTSHSDHSLNISEEVTQKFMAKGVRLILGHEHNKRILFDGGLYITGNQWPTSIQDCLDPNGRKEMHIIELDGSITPRVTWDGSDYIDLPIDDVTQVKGTHKFIRVSGVVSSDKSRAALETVRRLRNASNAYVVSNNIKPEGTTETGESVSLEQIQSFDIKGEIISRLTEKEAAIVKPILEDYVQND